MKKLRTLEIMLLLLLFISCKQSIDIPVSTTEIPLDYCNVTIPKTEHFSVIGTTWRDVKLNSFLMCDHEVTQGEWKWVMGSVSDFIPTAQYGKGEYKPMYSVSWLDALKFCNTLSKKQGLTPCYTIDGEYVECNFAQNGYRLPTIAEWEYASCAGIEGDLPYSGATSINEENYNDYLWYEPNSGYISHDVKTKKANGFDLYDMSGNVWEWCWDWYDENYNETDNPTGPTSGTKKAYRGGGFKCPNYYVRARSLSSKKINEKWYLLGFRVCRTKN